MTQYLQTTGELSNWMAKRTDAQLHTWLRDYIFENRTHPLIEIGRNDSPPFVLLRDLFDKGSKAFKRRFNAAIERIYVEFSDGKVPSGTNIGDAGGTLMTIIGVTENLAFFNKLVADATDEKYIGTALSHVSASVVDLHTYLLKTLFGLALAELSSDRNALAQTGDTLAPIIEQGIFDPKYSLECFHVACILWGQAGLARYGPTLAEQVTGAKRDVAGTLEWGARIAGRPLEERLSKAFE